MVKNHLVTVTILGILLSLPLQAQKLTLKERLETIRAARIIFYELDDYYRDIKRNFSKKSKLEIFEIKKKIGILDDKLTDLPPETHNGDIPDDCRSSPNKLYHFISILSGDYGILPTITDFTEQYRRDLHRRAEEGFLVGSSRCLTLFDEVEAKLLAQMKKP